MRHILRDSAAGQLIRFVTSNTVLLYPEEEPDFELPKSYTNLKIVDEPVNVDAEHSRGSSNESSVLVQEAPSLRVGSVQSKQGLEQDVELGDLSLPTEAHSTLPSLVPTLSQTPKSTSTSRVIRPVRTSDGNILVDWYTEDDAENPQNWSSPCLATGAATFQDMYSMIKIPYLLAFWAGSVTLGPAIAPIVAGFSVSAESWHWFAWEMLWLSAPICIVMCFFLPETSADNILLRRAGRLRKLSGRNNLKSKSEISQGHLSAREVTFNALIKPWEINILDPAVLFTTVYTALVYGIFYSFFESFPLVYPVIYHFNLGESSLPFLAVTVALAISMPLYCWYWYSVIEPRVQLQGFGPPEDRLVPALLASWTVPIGLFIFAWSTRYTIHWIVSVIGVCLTMIGTYTIMQCIFLYLPFTYPNYAASLFAANDFARSAFAAGCVLFSQPMFAKLGVPAGISLLGGLTE
ncbi:hypothetical protein VE00_08650 [Pseudogymnoascus sp. WSF 3629]|nr:hypothetical protein VE00_08650 [Pseudogymnoascus sp. WSF 3629]